MAASNCQSPELHQALIEKLDDPFFSNAAFAAIVNIAERMLPTLENAFYLTGQSERIQLRIVQIYGRINTPQAVELLLAKLTYSNQNVSSLALNTLSQCGHKMKEEDKIRTIHAELEELGGNLVWNMAVRLLLDKEESSHTLRQAVDMETVGNYEKIFSLLSLLYDPWSVDLVKTNLYSGNPEKAEFALELLDVLLSETVKPILIPLLNVSTTPWEKIRELQDYFPAENILKMSPEEVLLSLVQRDYKWVNRWTKACALYELSQLKNFQDASIFVANVVNPDPVMHEIAYKSLYEMDYTQFEENIRELKLKNNYTRINGLIRRMAYLEQESEKQVSRLKFDVAKFLSTVPDFKEITGLTLSEIAKITDLWEHKAHDIIARYDSIDEMDYYVVFSGSVLLMSDKVIIQRYESQGFINNLLYINQPIPYIKLCAEQDAIVYRIKQEAFNEILSFYDEIPLSILNHSHIQHTLLHQLYQKGFIHSIHALALTEVNKLARLRSYKASETIARYHAAENLDYFLIYQGQISLRTEKRELSRLAEGQLLSASHLSLTPKSPLQIIAHSDCALYQVDREALSALNTLLSKVEVLHRIKEFKETIDLNLLEIARLMSLRQYAEDEAVASYNEPGEMEYFIVLSGRLRLQMIKGGQEVSFNLEKTNSSIPGRLSRRMYGRFKLLPAPDPRYIISPKRLSTKFCGCMTKFFFRCFGYIIRTPSMKLPDFCVM
ncbi:MAG: hypothetical protein HC880_05025 [Bacteroidia bacterium]|nr:hypothetical protein [Bacteroidia bacterium]